MMEVHLYDSTFCRLCGEENSNGVLLFKNDESDTDLSGLVNRYLPFKVYDDGKLPRTICPGCNIQLQSTVQFFDLLVDGQKRIRALWKNQLEYMRRAEKERLRSENEGSSELLMTTTTSAHDPNGSDTEGENRIVIQIMADGSLYSTDHEMTLKMEGLDKPRRKRGRPKKVPQPEPEQPPLPAEEPEPSKDEELPPDDELDEDADKRRRRKRKAPIRYLEAVRGKELERMFREEGVIDDDEPDDGEDDEVEEKVADEQDVGEEVIGHLENQEGQDLGELVIVNKSKSRGRPRGKRRKHRFQCEVCGRGFQHKGRYIIHKSYHKGVKYECSDCNKRFTSRETFELHQKTTGHSGEGIIEGLEDGKDVMELPAKNRFPCSQCDKTFQTKQSYEVHLKAIHEGQKPFICEICSKMFAYHNSLKAHMTVHEEQRTEKGYPCEVCGKTFNHPSSVIYHKEAEHNNGRRFVCNKCGKGFKHKQLLQRHQLVHSDNRPFACKVCGATFKTKANLLNHQPTHTGEKKYFCELCGQQFAHKTSLTLHYRWHTGHKPYQCHVCNKSFSQNGNLQEHLRIHTGEKPYCCDYCGRKFTTSSQFKLHVKRHTGERPWKCEFCAKSFLHKDTWKCHTRRHKGERPFQCHYCARSFTEQWALKKHLRLHTGEKPYVCNVCGKAFADCSNLTKHKKGKHRDLKEEENPVTQDTVPVDGTVWNIIRSHLSNEAARGEGTEDDGTGGEGVKKEDDIQQIIYVTYQDPEDPGEARTLHIVDGIQEEAAPTLQEDKSDPLSQITAEVQPEEVVGPEPDPTQLQLDQLSQTATIQLEPQLHVTDQDGNAIQFTIQDGIPTGNVQSIEVAGTNFHLTSDGQAFTAGLAPHLPTVTEGDSEVPDIPGENQQVSAQAVTGDMLALVGSDQTLELVTPDGQKVYRFVTAYNVDQQQLAADYLSTT
ncbi:hypothetical protein R5R35_006488 [Gryllus longicercus]|uniref:Zinc finger protein n=1 Tax=Gryllus longicercus TaxID=2509291 RepID=A0AAN9V204_9ORTH